MIIPAPGFLLLEIVDPPTKSKLAKVNDNQEDSNYGKVLDWGKPLVQEGGVVLEVPQFIIGSNEEGMGGSNRKLKKGDIIVFDDRTVRKMSDDYSSGPKIVQVRFDCILALYEEDK